MFMDDVSGERIAYSLYQQGSTNRAQRERMKRILSRAMRYGLTDRQRDCMTMYYLEGMKMKDIAKAMGLSSSTVSRHITAATKKLRKVASYYKE